MEFLVNFDVVGLDSLPEEQVLDLRRREKEAGEEHMREGRLLRMWRVPGSRSAIGIWRTSDADELHRHLSSLPLYNYLEIVVRPLARHYLEETPAFVQR